MSSLVDQINLAANASFIARVEAAIVHAAISIINEVANEVQTLHVSGSPTGGSFSLTSLPGFSSTQTGTLTISSASVTGLTSTVGLSVGMLVSGTNVSANTTIASITSATAITLSANATASGAQSLTFTGGGTVVVPWNATAAQLQTLLMQQPAIGTNNALCTGGPLPGTDVVITFQGALANVPLPLITVGVNNLTGGSSPVPSVSRTTSGVAFVNHGPRLVLAKAILTNPSTYSTLMAIGVADNATVQADFPAPNYVAVGTPSTIDNDIQFQVNSIFNAYT